MELILIIFVMVLLLEDWDVLWCVKQVLESLLLMMKLMGVFGVLVEKMIVWLLDFVIGKINDVMQFVLCKCLNIVLCMFGKLQVLDVEFEKFSNLLYKFVVVMIGVVGGVFGFFVLLVELLVMIMLIFCLVCDIVCSEGEDLMLVDMQLQCLVVFGMGGNLDKQEEDVDFGYFVLCGVFVQVILKVLLDIMVKGIVVYSLVVVFKFVQMVVLCFLVQVIEQMVVKLILVIGVVFGVIVNMLFIDYFQQMVYGYFIVCWFECKYGLVVVKVVYQVIDVLFMC